MSQPPKSPKTMKSAESRGMASSMAPAFGEATKSTGSTDIMRSPSSCSVATIEPISEAIAEPARPVTRRAVSTGPSSRIRLSPTIMPRDSSAPKRVRVL